MIISKFEIIRMQEDETIASYYAKLKDLTNQADALGKTFSNRKLVKKVLRSPTKKFSIKVTSLEDRPDLKTMTIDQLIGSLETYEMKLDEEKEATEKIQKNLAFQVVAY